MVVSRFEDWAELTASRLRHPSAGSIADVLAGAPMPARPRRTPLRTWKQFGLALLGLAYVIAIAAATMIVGGLVLHALDPSRVIDVFAAAHNQIVVAILLGLATLWLLPPYPWASEARDGTARPPAEQAGEGEAEDASNVIALAGFNGRDVARRPRTQEGAPFDMTSG